MAIKRKIEKTKDKNKKRPIIKIKKNKREKRARNQNKKWGILKYLSAKISFEKSKTIQGQTTYECRILGQKMGYDKLIKIWLWEYLKLRYLAQFVILAC